MAQNYKTMIAMGRVCGVCARGAQKIYARSKSNIGTIQHQRINLQVRRVGGIKLRVCTSCLKTIKKYAAMSEPAAP